jgi:hypothetical protein
VLRRVRALRRAALISSFLVASIVRPTIVPGAEPHATRMTTSITRVTVDPLLRDVVVSFVAPATGESQCSVTPSGTAPRYANCTSPVSYPNLRPGLYTVSVQAVVSGTPGRAATRSIGVPIEFSPCFGAAPRDRTHPCNNPALAGVVFPTPEAALLEPVQYCGIPFTHGGPVTCGLRCEAAVYTGRPATAGASSVMDWSNLARW